MTDTAAEAIRDDLIANDVRFRRADGHVRRLVNRRLGELERDLKKVMVDIDPNGAQRTDARRRRTIKLRMKVKELVDKAYQDINAIVRGELRKAAKVETQATANIMRKAIP